MIFLTTNPNDLHYLYHLNGGDPNVIILWIEDGVIKHRYTPTAKYKLSDAFELIEKFDYAMATVGPDIRLDIEANGNAVIWDGEQYFALTNRKVYVSPIDAYKSDTCVSSQCPSIYAKKLPEGSYEVLKGRGYSITLVKIDSN